MNLTVCLHEFQHWPGFCLSADKIVTAHHWLLMGMATEGAGRDSSLPLRWVIKLLRATRGPRTSAVGPLWRRAQPAFLTAACILRKEFPAVELLRGLQREIRSAVQTWTEGLSNKRGASFSFPTVIFVAKRSRGQQVVQNVQGPD